MLFAPCCGVSPVPRTHFLEQTGPSARIENACVERKYFPNRQVVPMDSSQPQVFAGLTQIGKPFRCHPAGLPQPCGCCDVRQRHELLRTAAGSLAEPHRV